MKTDELRRELLDIAADVDPFDGDLARVRGRVQRRRIALAGALLVLLAVPVGIVATRQGGDDQVSVARSPKSVALEELNRIEAVVMVPFAQVDLANAALDRSPAVAQYAVGELCGATESSPGFSPMLVELNAGEAPEQLVDQLPPDAIVKLWRRTGPPTEWREAAAEIFMSVDASRSEIDAVRRSLESDPAVERFEYVDQQAPSFRVVFSDVPVAGSTASFDTYSAQIDDISGRYGTMAGVDEVSLPPLYMALACATSTSTSDESGDDVDGGRTVTTPTT